jgi:tripartite-type tricarboxylate transporter receptor subunit TctC
MRSSRAPRGRTRRSALGLAAAAAASVALLAPAMAQDKWPSKPVKVIVPYPAGGIADQVARLVTPGLEKEFKQSFVIENKPGATGGIGAQLVSQSPPDGYTIMVTLIGASTLPLIAKHQGKPPMYTREQLAPIARIVSDPCVIYVQKGAPWNSYADLIADAKKRPNEIIFISTGPYGPTHLPMEMLMQATGTKFRHLPTTGGAPAINMLLSGGGHLFFSVPALGVQHVQSGAFKVLATSSTNRVPEFPDVPTMKELGVDMEFESWAAMFTPAGVPVEIQKQLDAAVTKTVADPALQETFKKIGMPIAHQNREQFAAWWDKDTQRLDGIIKTIVEAEKAAEKK